MSNSTGRDNERRSYVASARRPTKQILIVSSSNDVSQGDDHSSPFEDLSEAIDVYNAWIDACEEVNKSEEIET